MKRKIFLEFNYHFLFTVPFADAHLIEASVQRGAVPVVAVSAASADSERRRPAATAHASACLQSSTGNTAACRQCATTDPEWAAGKCKTVAIKVKEYGNYCTITMLHSIRSWWIDYGSRYTVTFQIIVTGTSSNSNTSPDGSGTGADGGMQYIQLQMPANAQYVLLNNQQQESGEGCETAEPAGMSDANWISIRCMCKLWESWWWFAWLR